MSYSKGRTLMSGNKGEKVMKVNREIREVLTWDFAGLGLFECISWDGKITDIRFCRKGSNVESQGLFASNGCEDFLKAVYSALGEVLKHLNIKTEDMSK